MSKLKLVRETDSTSTPFPETKGGVPEQLKSDKNIEKHLCLTSKINPKLKTDVVF
jgi:hypothetical protein